MHGKAGCFVRRRPPRLPGHGFYADSRDKRAGRLFEEVLALSRKVNGPHHSQTVEEMFRLACFYFSEGNKCGALELLEELMPFSRKVNGPEHPVTLISMGYLASCHDDAGRTEEALKLCNEVLHLLDRNAKCTARINEVAAALGLGRTVADRSWDAERCKLSEELLQLSRKLNGTEHANTLAAMLRLARSYERAGRKEAALKLREESLSLSRKVCGTGHLDTLIVMLQLANSYTTLRCEAEALLLRQEVLHLGRNGPGKEYHCLAFVAMDAIACSDPTRHNWDKGIKLREALLEFSLEVIGPEALGTLSNMEVLALYYRKAGRLTEAIELQGQALATLRS